MELLNTTQMKAGYTLGMKPDGRELLVVVVKGTFVIPSSTEKPDLAAVQMPLVMADTFTGAAGFSAPVYESEFAYYKPRCDVLLLGRAYAPHGEPSRVVPVTLRVGKMKKTFNAVGDRTRVKTLFGYSTTEPQLFTEMSLSYDSAYGGFDYSHKDEEKHLTFPANPVGQGFHVSLLRANIEHKQLPNTEEVDCAATAPDGRYRSMGFGPIGRAWAPRLRFAGTYDQAWQDNVFPFLPADFDERHFQSAPPDQQTDYLIGGEEVELTNLTPGGQTRFILPCIETTVTFRRTNGLSELRRAELDTAVFEPDLRRFFFVWRASIPLRKSLHEISQVAVKATAPSQVKQVAAPSCELEPQVR